MGRAVKQTLSIIGSFILILSFQNCSNFSASQNGSGNSTSNSVLYPAPQPPPVAPPLTTSGQSYYFSDCVLGTNNGCVPGNNSNSGLSSSSPKQNLSGFNVNTLPAGTQLRFARGGSWNWTNLRLENNNVTPTNPLVIDAYGSGASPRFYGGNLGNASAIDFGTYNNTTNDGGYAIRNVVFDGGGRATTGLFLIHNLRNVTLESLELTGFEIAIQSQSREPYGVNNVVIRNCNIYYNGSMGILGQFIDTIIEGNLFEANNFSGSGFNHGTYLSGHNGEPGHAGENGGTNVTLRNNRYNRNSVVNGVCTGGNMTFHGMMDGVLIENNLIEQDAAEPGCWAMSITQGYNTAEGFRNFIVRNNTIINAGNTAIAAQSAPGILIENNIIVNTQNTNQTAIGVGNGDYPNGDIADNSPIVRNNTACYVNPLGGSAVVNIMPTVPNPTNTGNVMLTGSAATAGVCNVP